MTTDAQAQAPTTPATELDEQLTIQSADAVELELAIVGIGGRSFAFIIDWHIRFILALAWFFGVGSLLAVASGYADIQKALELGGNLLAMLIWLPAAAIYFLYHPLLEMLMKGRTPGKRMAGIRIVDTQGRTPTLSALLVRNVFRLVDGLPAMYMLGFCVAMFTPRSVRIGDLAAGTLLVYERRTGGDELKRVMDISTRDDLTPTQREFLDDILARWFELTEDTRLELAARFLRGLGDERMVAEAKNVGAMHRYLKQLAAGELSG